MDHAAQHQLPPAEHRRIFHEHILPHVPEAAGGGSGRVSLVGGQPGAPNEALLETCSGDVEPGAPAVRVSADALRAFHPRYQALLAADDKTAAACTGHDALGWAVALAAELVARGQHVWVEGLLGEQSALEALCGVVPSPRHISVRALAVAEAFSLMGIELRYERTRARGLSAPYTLFAEHSRVFRALPGLADELARRGADVRMLDRVLVPLLGAGSPSALIEAERSRPLTPTEKVELASGWMEVWALKQAREATRSEREVVRTRVHRALWEVHEDPAAREGLRARVSAEVFRETETLAAAVARSRSRSAR